MSVDWDKPIQTRSGKKARFIGMRNHPTYPRVVAVTHYTDRHCTNAYEHIDTYTEDGIAYKEQMQHPNDIINVPERHVLWLNCYSGAEGEVAHCYWHESREGADHWASSNRNRRIACIKIEFEEGEGL